MKSKKVVIFAAGHSIVEYKDAILRYLETDDFTTIGCKNIGSIIRPDYHCWFDSVAFERDAEMLREKGLFIIQKGSIPVFLQTCKRKLIRKYWRGKYKTIKCKFTTWNAKSPYPHYMKRKSKFWGAFINTGCLSIYWAHIKGFTEINVVGMDGYSFHSKCDLISGEASQHCCGKGFTFSKRKGYSEDLIKKEIDSLYEKMKYKDKKILRTLTHFKTVHNVNFRILTPTAYDQFYDSSILK